MRTLHTVKLGSTFVAVMLLTALGCAESGPGLENLSATTKVMADSPPLLLLDGDGHPFDLWQSNPACPMVAIFTRSDCPVSNRYAPIVRALYERFKPQGVEFYLIYVDPRETADSIQAHLAEYEYPCPALRDPKHTLAAATKAKVTPEAVVFDETRNMVYRGRIDDLYTDLGKARSAPTRHDLADAIEATLAGRPVTEPVTKAVGCNIEDLK